MIDMISQPSPNYDGRDGQTVDMLIMHYTDMMHCDDALQRLCNPEAKVSAHYVVSESGDIYQLVAEDMRAWHAGVSHWRGESNINARSIGIEICNRGHGHDYPDFPAAQMAAVSALSSAILARHPIPARNVVGHSDIAFERKKDPGEKFAWAWLAQQGVGMFPLHAPDISGVHLARGDTGADVMRLQQALANWGYGLKVDGKFHEKTEACVIAFQRHYRPVVLDGVWDGTCAGLLATLLAEA
jgi:N-acetylmuramoyl-L-alanine amidase